MIGSWSDVAAAMTPVCMVTAFGNMAAADRGHARVYRLVPPGGRVPMTSQAPLKQSASALGQKRSVRSFGAPIDCASSRRSSIQCRACAMQACRLDRRFVFCDIVVRLSFALQARFKLHEVQWCIVACASDRDVRQEHHELVDIVADRLGCDLGLEDVLQLFAVALQSGCRAPL